MKEIGRISFVCFFLVFIKTGSESFGTCQSYLANEFAITVWNNVKIISKLFKDEDSWLSLTIISS